MKFSTLGNIPQQGTVSVKNSSATITIPKGAPVYYKHDTTSKPGFDVLSAEGLSAINQRFFAGIAKTELAPGVAGDAHAYGFYDEVRVFQRSRAASTDDWPSAAAVAVGEYLSVLTAASSAGYTNQCFSALGTNFILTDPASSNATQSILVADYILNWVVRVAESFSSTATVASASTNSLLLSYVNLRCQIRAL